MKAKVGDVIRITHHIGVSSECRHFMQIHGDCLVITYIGDLERKDEMYDFKLTALNGSPMYWKLPDDDLIPLFPGEYTIEPFLTAVRARRHA